MTSLLLIRTVLLAFLVNLDGTNVAIEHSPTPLAACLVHTIDMLAMILKPQVPLVLLQPDSLELLLTPYFKEDLYPPALPFSGLNGGQNGRCVLRRKNKELANQMVACLEERSLNKHASKGLTKISADSWGYGTAHYPDFLVKTGR
eukprot:1161979-Pelagomonas_calceolata.AAC.2